MRPTFDLFEEKKDDYTKTPSYKRRGLLEIARNQTKKLIKPIDDKDESQQQQSKAVNIEFN